MKNWGIVEWLIFLLTLIILVEIFRDQLVEYFTIVLNPYR